MRLLLRKLRLFGVRYLVPDVLEGDPEFRATMDALTRRGDHVHARTSVNSFGG